MPATAKKITRSATAASSSALADKTNQVMSSSAPQADSDSPAPPVSTSLSALNDKRDGRREALDNTNQTNHVDEDSEPDSPDRPLTSASGRAGGHHYSHDEDAQLLTEIHSNTRHVPADLVLDRPIDDRVLDLEATLVTTRGTVQHLTNSVEFLESELKAYDARLSAAESALKKAHAEIRKNRQEIETTQVLIKALTDTMSKGTKGDHQKVERAILPPYQPSANKEDNLVIFILYVQTFKDKINETHTNLNDETKKNQLIAQIQKHVDVDTLLRNVDTKALSFEEYCTTLTEKYVKTADKGISLLSSVLASTRISTQSDAEWTRSLRKAHDLARCYMILYEIWVQRDDEVENKASNIATEWKKLRTNLVNRLPTEITNAADYKECIKIVARSEAGFTEFIDALAKIGAPSPTHKRRYDDSSAGPTTHFVGQQSSGSGQHATAAGPFQQKKQRTSYNQGPNQGSGGQSSTHNAMPRYQQYPALTFPEATEAQQQAYWKKYQSNNTQCIHKACKLQHDYKVCRFNPDCIKSRFTLEQLKANQANKAKRTNTTNGANNINKQPISNYDPIFVNTVAVIPPTQGLYVQPQPITNIAQIKNHKNSQEQPRANHGDGKTMIALGSPRNKKAKISKHSTGEMYTTETTTTSELNANNKNMYAHTKINKPVSEFTVGGSSGRRDKPPTESDLMAHFGKVQNNKPKQNTYKTKTPMNYGYINRTHKVKVHIDIGAQVSSVSYEFLKSHPKLYRKIHHRPKYFANVTGDKNIPSLGTIKINISLEGLTFQGKFEVMNMPYWHVNLGTDKYDFELKLFEKGNEDIYMSNHVASNSCDRTPSTIATTLDTSQMPKMKKATYLLPKQKHLPKCLSVDDFRKQMRQPPALPPNKFTTPPIICTIHDSHSELLDDEPRNDMQRQIIEKEKNIILHKFLEKELSDNKYLKKPYTEKQKAAITKLMWSLKKSFAIHKTDKPGRYTGGPPINYQPQRPLPVVNQYSRMSPSMRKITIDCLQQLTTLGHVKPFKEGKSFHRFMVKPKPNRNPPEGRPLNDLALKNKSWDQYNYPLPRIDEELDKLKGSKWFTKLDMTHGYAQIPLAEEMHKYFTFSLPSVGVYTYTVIPQGWSPAGAIFEEIVEYTLGDTRYKCCIVYLDDNIIHSPTFEQHLIDIKEVVTKYTEAGFRFSLSKTSLAKNACECLGHYTDGESTKPLTTKTEAINNRPPPESKEELRSWIQLCNYYRKYINQFAVVAHPLYQLLKKDCRFNFKTDWQTDSKELRAFNKLKALLTTEPIMLHHPDPEREYILHVDGSQNGYGAILCQLDKRGDERVIAYWSKVHKSKVRSHYFEIKALVEAVKHFKYYLLGTTIFHVVGDHKPLTALMKNEAEGVKQEWKHYLQSYNFTYNYRPGSEIPSDYLSRPSQSQINVEDRITLSKIETMEGRPKIAYKNCIRLQPEATQIIASLQNTVDKINSPETEIYSIQNLTDSLAIEQTTDYTIQKLLEKLRIPIPDYREMQYTTLIMRNGRKRQIQNQEISRNNKTRDELIRLHRDFEVRHNNELWRKPPQQATNNIAPHLRTIKTVPVIPSKWVPKFIERAHADILCHRNAKQTVIFLRQQVYWLGPSMLQSVKEWIKKCDTCALHPFTNKLITEQYTMIPLGRNHILNLDHMDKLPHTPNGNTCAIILQDPFDDLAKIIPAKTKTAKETAQLIWEHWLTDPIGGFPKIIQHDGHKTFLSDVIKCLREMYNIEVSVSSPGSHGKTSKVERTIRTFNNMLSKMISENQTDWDTKCNQVWKAHAMCVSSATGYSPIYMRTLMHPNLPEIIPFAEKSAIYTQPKQFIDEMSKTFNDIVTTSLTYRRHLADTKHKLLLKPRLPHVHEYESLSKGQKVLRLHVNPLKEKPKPATENTKTPSKIKDKLGTFWEHGYTVLDKIDNLTYKLGYEITTKTGKIRSRTVNVHRKHIKPCTVE